MREIYMKPIVKIGLLSNKIRREQLNAGDHIYTWRNGYSYSHHGIYVGDRKVIHLTRQGPSKFSSSNECEDRVVCCSIEEFLDGGDLYLYEYGVSRALSLIKRGGTCTRFSSDPPKDVLHRAYILLGKKGFGGYNLVRSNCEDFAIYCKTGLLTADRSKPGRSGQIKFLYAIFLALTLTPYQFLPSGLTSLALVVGLYCGFIFELDRGVDKVAVEKFGERLENGSGRRFLPIGEFIASAVWVFRYYSVAVGIAYRIRSVLVPESFDDLLRNHSMIQILGGSAGFILWIFVLWRFFGSGGGIYFWSRVGFLCGFLLLILYDHQGGYKLLKYISHAIIVLGFWYWTRDSRILLWKRIITHYEKIQ